MYLIRTPSDHMKYSLICKINSLVSKKLTVPEEEATVAPPTRTRNLLHGRSTAPKVSDTLTGLHGKTKKPKVTVDGDTSGKNLAFTGAWPTGVGAYKT